MRDALGLDRVHLLGTSWGGMLAQEYALTRPEGLESLVLSSTLASADSGSPRPAADGRARAGRKRGAVHRRALLPPRPTAAGDGDRGRRSATRRSTRRCGARTSGRAPAGSRAGDARPARARSGSRRWSSAARTTCAPGGRARARRGNRRRRVRRLRAQRARAGGRGARALPARSSATSSAGSRRASRAQTLRSGLPSVGEPLAIELGPGRRARPPASRP